MNIRQTLQIKLPRYSQDDRSGEQECYKFIQERFNPKVVFSVGAQKDFELCKIFENAEIHLFEPNKYAFRELINDEYLIKRPNIVFNNFGLGNEEKYFTYFYNGESVYNHDGKNETDRIFITTLAKYVQARNVDKIDFIKIDTEGFEYEVLKGAGGFLDKIDLVQFEYGERYPLAKKTLKMMFDLFPDRYMYHIEEDGLNLVPYIGEYFIYSNYLASKIKL